MRRHLLSDPEVNHVYQQSRTISSGSTPKISPRLRQKPKNIRIPGNTTDRQIASRRPSAGQTTKAIVTRISV